MKHRGVIVVNRHLAMTLAVLILTCLGSFGQESTWEKSIDAGKAAMEKRQYADAEKAFQAALTAAEKFGEKDARFAATLLFLAQACDAQAKKDAAETFARHSAASMEMALKSNRPKDEREEFYQVDVAAVSIDKAGDIFASHQKYAEAEDLFKRVIKIRARAAEEIPETGNNPDFFRFLAQVATGAQSKLADAEEKLGSIYFTEHKLADAAGAYEKAVKTRERLAQPRSHEAEEKAVHRYLAEHNRPEIAAAHEKARQARAEDELFARGILAHTLTNLATCYAAQASYARAEPIYLHALALYEQANWGEKPENIQAMQYYALLLQKSGREAEARAMLEKVAAIRKKLGQIAQ